MIFKVMLRDFPMRNEELWEPCREILQVNDLKCQGNLVAENVQMVQMEFVQPVFSWFNRFCSSRGTTEQRNDAGDASSEASRYGGHVMCVPGAKCQVAGVLGFRMGQENIMGRRWGWGWGWMLVKS